MPEIFSPLGIMTYVLAVIVGFGLYYAFTKVKVSKANVDASKIIDEATAKADNIVKEAILDAKT
ncbi:MAG: Rnase Y domain-containing protein, partial [Coprobacillus sp.]